MTTQRDQSSLQYMLPSKFQRQALCTCHDDVGCLGIESSTNLLKDRFYWVGMSTDMNISRNVTAVSGSKATHKRQTLIPF